MYKFTIEYYFYCYHTGELNTRVTRTATVYAKNLGEAINKTAQVDNECKAIANVTFEETTEVNENA